MVQTKITKIINNYCIFTDGLNRSFKHREFNFEDVYLIAVRSRQDLLKDLIQIETDSNKLKMLNELLNKEKQFIKDYYKKK